MDAAALHLVTAHFQKEGHQRLFNIALDQAKSQIPCIRDGQIRALLLHQFLEKYHNMVTAIGRLHTIYGATVSALNAGW